MANKSQGAAAKWQAAMQSGATQTAYKDGIQNTVGNPMQKSADAEQAYLQGVQEAVSSGRRRAALMATPLSAWKDAAINKGAQRLTSGAQAAASKVQAHFQKWGPIYDQASAAAAALPNLTMEDKINRVRAAMQVLRSAAGKST